MQSRPWPAAEKSRRRRVAGSRSRRLLRRRSSVRPEPSSSQWAWFGQRRDWKSRHGCHRSALSPIAPTTASLAPARASPARSMSSSVSVEFLAGREQARMRTVLISARLFAVMIRRVRCSVGEGVQCEKGNGCLSLASWAVRVSPLRSARCEPRRERRRGHGAHLVAPPHRQLRPVGIHKEREM